MTTRITGLNSGLDVDALVEAGASYYQNKVNKAKQSEQKLEWQQEQYRAIQSSVQNFYDKYLSINGTDSLMMSSNWNTNSYTSSDSSKVSVSSTSDANIDSYSVSVTQLASAATTTLTTNQMTGNGNKLSFRMDTNGDGKVDNNDDAAIDIDISGCTSDAQRATAINNALKTKGYDDDVTATSSEFAGGIIFKSSNMGSKVDFTVTVGSITQTATGTDLQGTIKNSAGIPHTLSGASNTLTMDNVTFNFTGTTASSGTSYDSDTNKVTVTGTKDVSDVQDKIQSFMDDYNTLIKTINGKIYETYNKSYQPLTDSEKSSMSDSQITKWETKAQTGLLRHDSYLEKLASDMKSAMSSIFGNAGAGINIESIGIKAVNDYTTKNGTYTVNSDTLKTALEGGITKTDSSTKKTKTITFDDIKNLFTNGNTKISSLTIKNSDADGILSRLKVAFNTNATMSSSELAKRAGIQGTISETTNEITQLLKDQNTLIDDLEQKFSDKEDALYSKYSKLETSLSSLQSSSSIFSS